MEHIRATGNLVNVKDGIALVPWMPASIMADQKGSFDDYPFALKIREGSGLSVTDAAVSVTGDLSGGVLSITEYVVHPRNSFNSIWGDSSVSGTDEESADRISENIPEGWKIISIDVSQVALDSDAWAVNIELFRRDDATDAWLREQPSGSVNMTSFIENSGGVAE